MAFSYSRRARSSAELVSALNSWNYRLIVREELVDSLTSADLAGLQNLTVTGIWDADAARIAF